MNILFAWILNYKNINNIQINFGGEHLYSIEGNNLTCGFNDRYIPSFFNLDDQQNRANLLNVTGIVGENGTGKSSIIEFILRVFNDSISEYSPETRFILIYTVDSKYYYLQNLDNHIYTIEGKRHDITSSFTLNNIRYQNKTLGPECSIIFFSNIYDARAIDRFAANPNSTTKIMNLSTNYFSTKYNESFNRSLKADFTKQFIFSKEYEEYILSNTQLNIPEYISISIDSFNDSEEDDRLTDPDENYDYYTIINNIDEEFEALVDDLQYDTFQLVFHQHLLMSFFADIIFQINKLAIDSFVRNTILELINETSHDLSFQHNPEKSKDIYKTLRSILFQKLDDLSNYKSIEKNIESPISDCKRLINKFIKTRKKLIALFNKIYNKDLVDNLSLKLKTNTPDIKDFVKIYHLTTLNYSYLNFFWSELSSGEHAFLNLFGRFHSASRESTQNILILIDEGDLYFHPQWQKEWFLLFVNLITLMFASTNMHIILTTHSPFVLSDLPGNNVLFLKKDIYGRTATGKGLDENIQTFASNIHTLLIDSFFIKNGLCGSFAKYKINKLIDYILNTNVESLKLNKKKIQTEIDIIGEPLVKKKIISMLQDKIGLDVLNIDAKISNLQRQIDELRKMN